MLHVTPERRVRHDAARPAFAGLTLGLALFAACATAPPPTALPQLPVIEMPGLEERALLLLLANRHLYEAFTVDRAAQGDAALRRDLAAALGRAGVPEGGPTLELLLADADPEVRRAAAFALGELGEAGYAKGSAALERALVDPDRGTGRLAVAALAKLGVPLEEVVTRLVAAPPAELFPRLAPSLFRFSGAGVVRWAEQLLAADDPQVHAMAAYALAREPRPEAAPLLRGLLADPDPWVRGWAARALGRIGDGVDLDRIRTLLDDPEPGPIIQTLRAARRLLTEGKAAPPESWRPRLLELLADPRPGVRLTAIETAASWLRDEELGAALRRAAAAPLRRERELALLALAEGQDPEAEGLLAAAAADPDPVLRARSAQAAGFYRAGPLLARLAKDRSPQVRVAALETRLLGDPPEAAGWVAEALQDPDPAVRATALEWTLDHPVLPLERLLAAGSPAWHDPFVDARTTAVRALVARAEAEPLERGTIVAALEELARDPEYLVRRQAVAGLGALDRPQPEVGPVADVRTVDTYREIFQRTAEPRRVEIVTERGTLTVELACPTAPLTCLNFLQLAAQGFYDGLTFHRVVPDFVVQGGDPRGDGWGGPGYTIRDETSPLGYQRGVIGMALSGADTGGSQFFITLSRQPHLDGGYTAFGRVVEGEAVLDEIVQGDHMVRVVELSGR